jgi:hypothetical protein
VQDVAEPGEVEQLDQAAVRAVEQEPLAAPGRDDLQPSQRVHRTEIGGHQPRHVQVDDVSPTLVLAVPRPHRRLL